MMVGEIAVHFGEKQMMLTRQQLGELLDHGSGGAIAGIPTDTKGSAVKILQQPLDIPVHDVDAFRSRSAFVPVAFGRHPAQFLDVSAEEGSVLKDHFEAVVIGGIMAARSEEHTSELQSLMRISYAVFCLKKKTHNKT